MVVSCLTGVEIVDCVSLSIFWALGEGCGFLLLPSLYLRGGGIVGISSDVVGSGISMMSGN